MKRTNGWLIFNIVQTEKETILYISHHITKDNAIFCVYKFMRVGTEQTAYLLYTEGEMD